MLSDNIRGYVIVQLSYVMFRIQLTQIGKYAMGTQNECLGLSKGRCKG